MVSGHQARWDLRKLLLRRGPDDEHPVDRECEQQDRQDKQPVGQEPGGSVRRRAAIEPRPAPAVRWLRVDTRRGRGRDVGGHFRPPNLFVANALMLAMTTTMRNKAQVMAAA